MMEKREEHLEEEETRAKRVLEDHSRRWPMEPNTFYVLLIIVLIVILFLAF